MNEEATMTLGDLEKHILSHFDAETEHPFDKDKSVTVFRRADNKKWFAATKNIGCRFVNVEREGRVDILNVWLDPYVVTSLRTREGFRPAWHMNQNRWVTILLDGSVSDEDVLSLLDEAYDEAGIKGRKR